MQVGQCGNQEAHAEVLCRMRRAAHAIAARDSLPQCRLSCNEHSEQTRAPHTNGPIYSSRCGALSLLQKPLKNSN
jgi:hypothetical protein